MNDPFEKKVRAAAVAGWWVVLIGYGLLVVTWLAFLGLLSARPAWLLTMWGLEEANWTFVQTVSLWFMAAFKFLVWLLILVALWLTLWARQLSKMNRP